MNKKYNVVWKHPESEDNDYNVHIQYNSEHTLCGLAYEGVGKNPEQNFVGTKKELTCNTCINIIKFCNSL